MGNVDALLENATGHVTFQSGRATEQVDDLTKSRGGRVVVNFTAEEIRIAEGALKRIAPDELPLLAQLAAKPGWRERFTTDSIGYGIEVDVAVIAPYALLAATWARGVVGDEAKQVLDKRLRTLTRRILRAREDKQPTPPGKPAEPVNQNALRMAVEEYAATLGLSKPKAKLLAEVVVGLVIRNVK